MLRTRVITALLLLPLVVALVLFAPLWLLAVVVGCVIILGAWEWAGLIGYRAALPRGLYMGLVGAVLALTFWLGEWRGIASVALSIWMLVCLWLMSPGFGRHTGVGMSALKGAVGLLTYAGALAGLLLLRNLADRGDFLLLVFAIIWAADTGAYFAGRRFGKRKLAPAISPGKTWAGLYGGVAGGVLVAALGGLLLGLPLRQILALLPVAVMAVMLSVAGDLFVSLIKRQAGAKDSGTLLPGHGGILDRIDSMLAALPLFAVAVGMLDHY